MHFNQTRMLFILFILKILSITRIPNFTPDSKLLFFFNFEFKFPVGNITYLDFE